MLLSSLIASFIPGTDAKSLSIAVNTIISNPTVVSGSTAVAVNINGKTYSTSISTSHKVKQQHHRIIQQRLLL